MLEYVIGRELLDIVIIKMRERYSTTPITFSGFRQLCEEEYGTSLTWFFDQWLNRTTAPEFAMQWKNEKTVRGMTVVKVLIEQRGDIFSTPINIAFQIGNRVVQKRIVLTLQKQEFSFVFPTPPIRVELDPQYNILRWLLEIRILAHARSAQLFLSINHDITTAEREALYTVQLDPNNSTGSIPFAYYILGKISVLKNDLEKAKEYFLKAMPLSGTRETESYKLWSLIRYANIVELEGKRDNAIVLLQRAISEGRKDPLIFERTIIEAGKYLRENFVSSDDVWYGAF
jgi:tetratricopeptide (TPR) repeat protein